MIFLLAFWLFLAGAMAIGWQAGDRHDRTVIAAIGVAAAASAAAHLLLPGPAALIAVAAVDIALLALVVRHALATQRHWPVWFAGFHGAATVFAVAAPMLPAELREAATLVSGFWSLPALVAMVAGLLSDQRRGIANARG